MQLVIALDGKGAWDDGRTVTTGQSWVLPASMASRPLTPDGKLELLLAELP